MELETSFTEWGVLSIAYRVRVLVSAITFSCFLPNSTLAGDSIVGHSFLEEHCVHCHDGSESEGGLNLSVLGFDSSDTNGLATWARIHDRIVAGEMPPADESRPDQVALDEFVRLSSDALRDAWTTRYATLGRVGGRRLNPVEYEHSMRDLLASTWLELKEMLPPDPESYGFDNMAEAQEISYVQLARYLEAAEVAIDGAMRLRPAPQPTKSRMWFTEEGRYLGKDWKERFASVDDRPQWTWFYQQPNSAQAPRRIRNLSQRLPGWYRFRVHCRAALWDKGEWKQPEEGQVAWINTAAKRILGKFDVPDAAEGGVVEFTAWQNENELLEFFYATADDRQVSLKTKNKDPKSLAEAHQQFLTTYRGHAISVDWFEIDGPYSSEACQPETDADWPSESFRTLFGDLPLRPWTTSSGLRQPESLNLPDLTANTFGLRESFQLPPDMLMVVSREPKEDAEGLLRTFMTRAYRRPPEESEVRRCLRFAIESIEQDACFQDAMRLAYKAALCSPDFLYFRESPGKLDGYAVASRLSYLLWRSMPDPALLDAAQSGELLTDKGLAFHFNRMLADGKSARFVHDFTGQWLDLRDVHATSPDRFLFPEYFCDNHLVDSGVAETEATFATMISDNLPVKNIVDADFVMVNERLATLYGMDGVNGSKIRRVEVPQKSPRGGLLTQCSVLKVTANGLTTSPVLRGVWVMDRILGQRPAAPPPDAGAIEPDTRGATTIRELLARHSRDASCANCHASIDPPGFALENFDVMGSWRENYRSLGEGERVEELVALREVTYKTGLPVDASGVTEEGESFNDFHDFREYLVIQEEQIARNLTERFLTFSTGAGVSFADREVIESILRENRENRFPIRSLLESIVLSSLFRHK